MEPNRSSAPQIKALLLRADASIQIGTGHIQRCIALGQSWQRRGGRVIIAHAMSTPAIDERLVAEHLSCLRIEGQPGDHDDAVQTIAAARLHLVDWIVADGYCFDTTWQKEIKDAGFRLIVLDDYGHSKHYFADLILNPNGSCDMGVYSKREVYTQLLVGPHYVLLRNEFQLRRTWQKEIPSVGRKVLVTLGGSDADNITGIVIDSLSDLQDIEVRIVVGGSNPNMAVLEAAVDAQQPKIKLVFDVAVMSEIMAWADVAVASAGTTAWELACMGLPCILIIQSENQRVNAETLDRKGFAKCMGAWRQVNPKKLTNELVALLRDSKRRNRMSGIGRALVDGRGAGRVTARMAAFDLVIRRAKLCDSHILWSWANEPSTRQASFSPDPISIEQHASWFAARLADKECFLYIAADHDGNLVGQIRFRLEYREATVSVSIAPEFRGRGYGSALILRGVEQLFLDSNANIVHAYIKMDNQLSMNTFERADFSPGGPVIIRGFNARHMFLTRDAHASQSA